MSKVSHKHENRLVSLNVGGQIFLIQYSTLADLREKKLLKVKWPRKSQVKDGIDKSMITGKAYIDRDPYTFKIILEYLRTEWLNPYHLQNNLADFQCLYTEAKFYELADLVDQLTVAKERRTGLFITDTSSPLSKLINLGAPQQGQEYENEGKMEKSSFINIILESFKRSIITKIIGLTESSGVDQENVRFHVMLVWDSKVADLIEANVESEQLFFTEPSISLLLLKIRENYHKTISMEGADDVKSFIKDEKLIFKTFKSLFLTTVENLIKDGFPIAVANADVSFIRKVAEVMQSNRVNFDFSAIAAKCVNISVNWDDVEDGYINDASYDQMSDALYSVYQAWKDINANFKNLHKKFNVIFNAVKKLS
ncbi:unnamed protein product [Gordionus sp. m RMFG-2023]